MSFLGKLVAPFKRKSNSSATQEVPDDTPSYVTPDPTIQKPTEDFSTMRSTPAPLSPISTDDVHDFHLNGGFNTAGDTPPSPFTTGPAVDFKSLYKPPTPVAHDPYMETLDARNKELSTLQPHTRPSGFKRALKGALVGMAGGNILGGIGGALGGAFLDKDYFNHREDARDQQKVINKYSPILAGEQEAEKTAEERRKIGIDEETNRIRTLSEQNQQSRYGQMDTDRQADNRRADMNTRLQLLYSLPPHSPSRQTMADGLMRDYKELGTIDPEATNKSERPLMAGDASTQGLLDPYTNTYTPTAGLGPKPQPNLNPTLPQKASAEGDYTKSTIPPFDAAGTRRRIEMEEASRLLGRKATEQEAAALANTRTKSTIDARMRDERETYNQTVERKVSGARAGVYRAPQKKSGSKVKTTYTPANLGPTEFDLK
jgi:hypothetical protein